MKNSTLIKGSAAIALGGALLLGGGGTLANWNASETTAPGTIVAGDLNVVNGVGTWKDRNEVTIPNIADYKVVPGDKLTFTQDLNVTLVGDKMAAAITASGITPTNGFTAENVTVSTTPVLTVGGATVSNPLHPTGATQTVKATITFEFKSSTAGRVDVGKSYNFNNVGFTLTQVNSTGDGLS